MDEAENVHDVEPFIGRGTTNRGGGEEIRWRSVDL
jgi:hypothetical protein